MHSTVTFRINAELLDKVRAFAKVNMLSVSDVIRQALLRYLKQMEKQE
jgi:hypothetical protein